MACPRLVVIGASAGGLEAVRQVLGGLGPDFPAAILIVIHTGADATGSLITVLGRATRMPVEMASDGQPIEPGHVYLPPPDFHLLLDDDRIALSRGPRQHGFRPAVDPLFISAADGCRGQVIGVILSGALGDGTLGLTAVKRAGGLAIVQNPGEAAFPSMPLTALKSVEVDYVESAGQIAARLAELVRRPVRRTPRHAALLPSAGLTSPGLTPNGGKSHARGRSRTSELTALICPNCGGPLWESTSDGVIEYACHVGHRFSPDALRELEADQLDRALWTAVRALKEDAILHKRMAEHADEHGMAALAAGWHDRARIAETNAVALRKIVEVIAPPTTINPAAHAADTAAAAERRPRSDRARRRKKDESPNAGNVGTRKRASARRRGSNRR